MTKLIINNSLTSVISTDITASQIIEETCTLTYDYFVRYRGSPRAQRKSRELRYFSQKAPRFPSGWVEKVVKQLQRFDVPYVIEDIREQPNKIDLPILAIPNEPWQHQKEALIAIEDHKRGIVRVPTRGGKTLIMALAIASFKVPTLVMVPNKTLLHQEYEVFSQVFGEERVGRLGANYQELEKDVLVATIQTLFSRMDDFWIKLCVFKRRGCIILDECHHINHGGYKLRNTYFEVAQKCERAYYRVGFTATPGKTNSLERVLLHGVAGKLIYNVDIETLKDQRILTPAKVTMVSITRTHTATLRERLEKRNIRVPSGVEIETVYRRNKIPIPSVPTFQEQLDEKVIKNDDFRRLVQTVAESYGAKGKSVIVMVSRIEHGVDVFSDPESPFYIRNSVGLSGQSEHRNEMLNAFREGRFGILVSTLVKEGVDIPRADVLILAAADVMDATPVLQRAGRVLTRYEGKTQAEIVDFYIQDDGILERHSRARMKLYLQNSFEIDIKTPKEIISQ